MGSKHGRLPLVSLTGITLRDQLLTMGLGIRINWTSREGWVFSFGTSNFVNWGFTPAVPTIQTWVPENAWMKCYNPIYLKAWSCPSVWFLLKKNVWWSGQIRRRHRELPSSLPSARPARVASGTGCQPWACTVLVAFGCLLPSPHCKLHESRDAVLLIFVAAAAASPCSINLWVNKCTEETWLCSLREALTETSTGPERPIRELQDRVPSLHLQDCGRVRGIRFSHLFLVPSSKGAIQSGVQRRF